MSDLQELDIRVPQEWAVWVAKKMDQIRTETVDPRAWDIAHTVQVEALQFISRPPTKHFLLFVQYQHDMNGKTWPRAWALVTYLKLASWYYRRKR